MVQWIDYYIDDNETIYVHIEESNATVNDTQGFNIRFGLPDINDLSGQSNLFLNHAKFSLNGFTADTAAVGNTVVYCLAGIVPEGTITGTGDGFTTLTDYQQVKGWPLKGCFGTATVGRGRDTDVSADLWQGFGSRVTWTKSYKPRSSLLISRLQEVTFCASLSSQVGFTSKNWDGVISMDLQLKRGD